MNAFSKSGDASRLRQGCRSVSEGTGSTVVDDDVLGIWGREDEGSAIMGDDILGSWGIGEEGGAEPGRGTPGWLGNMTVKQQREVRNDGGKKKRDP